MLVLFSRVVFLCVRVTLLLLVELTRGGQTGVTGSGSAHQVHGGGGL